MSKPSTIEMLPDPVREQINRLRDQHISLDEILTHLKKLDVEVSRSALGRYVKKQEQVAATIRRSRSLAEAVGRTFGDKETSQVARTNIELLHSMLMKLMIGEEDSDAEVIFDAKESMFMATALEKLSKASKLDIDREAKVREEERKLATKAAAEVAVSTARKQGLTAETVNAIRASILGVEA